MCTRACERERERDKEREGERGRRGVEDGSREFWSICWPTGSEEALGEAGDLRAGWDEAWWITEVVLSASMGATWTPAQPQEGSSSLCSGVAAGLKMVHGRI